MELFDLLEERVSELLNESRFLKEENERLKVASVGLAELIQENRTLKESLDYEQKVREDASVRVDSLLAMISKHIASLSEDNAQLST